MLTDFKRDLAEAKKAEEIALVTISALTDRYTLEDVSNQREFYYKGDIKAISKEVGVEFYIEVKDDSRIADTGRVLCEEEVYIKDTDRYIKGNMYCNTDIYCIVSQKERKIYILNFQKLKEIYKEFGEYKEIPHKEQITYCYLLDLCWCSKYGALMHKINY